ncbi:hypothetical protein F5Y18DRAFT_405014 [Xylariaceae sp. FL1019]|nr:hypothetical protein F5Y18DRAFT_405014 [Xylariaceae sp. FL1019]
MGVTFEGVEYQSTVTHPKIPYTIYVHDTYLLLVPRDVPQKHRAFPQYPAPTTATRRFTLQLNDHTLNSYKELCGKPACFDARHVDFGYEEDEGVVVAALLPQSNLIPYWAVRDMFADNSAVFKGNFTDESSDPQDGYREMIWDLKARE